MLTEPIRDKKHIKALSDYYLKRGNLRNYLLIVMGVYTALRISDLLRLRWEDVYDGTRQEFRRHIYLTERKTDKTKTIALNRKVLAALAVCLPQGQGARGFLFPNNRKNSSAISRVQAWRIIKKAVAALHLPGQISCHSLRKTFGYHAWRAGTPPVMLMDIYNHSSYDITRRYLGISQDDRDHVYLNLRLM